ncbi:MAG: hypothetical protein AAFN11_19615, partial [Chloroflexota bacterium]
MPVETTRIEAGIYHNMWQEAVTIEELLQAKTLIETLIAEDTLDECVVIICGEQTTKFPTDLRGLRSTVPDAVIYGFVYGIPRLGGLILNMFKPFSQVPFELVRSKEDAIALAQAKLQS